MHITLEKIIKNSPHLSWMQNNTALITLHGSRAYGTHTEDSDEDFKGVCISPKQYCFGFLNNFEQAELNEPDTVIYDIRKFFNLASKCNPSIIEVLFCDDSDIVYSTDIGEIIRENRDLFLSKKARYSFCGFAHSQLKRIKLHRGYLLNPPTKEPERSDFDLPERSPIPTHQLTAAQAAINKELDKLNFKFLDHLDNAERIEVRNSVIDLLTEFKIYHDDQYIAMAKKIGFDDNVMEILKQERAYSQAKREWDNYQHWKKNRNKERFKDEEKYAIDLKHAYHLIRLLRVGKEILTDGKVIVKRPDREELLEIRNGSWSYEKIIEEAGKIEKNMDTLYVESNLPHSPNLNKLNELCISLVEKQYGRS